MKTESQAQGIPSAASLDPVSTPKLKKKVAAVLGKHEEEGKEWSENRGLTLGTEEKGGKVY